MSRKRENVSLEKEQRLAKIQAIFEAEIRKVLFPQNTPEESLKTQIFQKGSRNLPEDFEFEWETPIDP